MRIAVVGAGAIGGFIAAVLARAGTDVSVVARGAHLRAIQERGLRVTGDLGTFTARMPASDTLAHLGPFDALLLTFKAHQWPSFLEQLKPFAGTQTTVVTLQNGVPFWFARTPPLRTVDPGGSIGAMFSDEQVIGGVVHASGNIPEPGAIAQSGGMRYPMGDPNGGAGARAKALCAALASAGLQSEIDANVRATVWMKVANNAGLNAVSALSRMTIAEMLGNPQSRQRVRTLMVETLEVGRAMGVVENVDVDTRIAYAERLADVKTSMLQDVEAGRPLEIDPILGAVVELGERYGVAVPALREAYAALAELSS